MGFLNPLLLLLGAAAAVPVLLHFLRRERDRRIPFPALRYLQRTTQEHAREIRLRQLLLLLVRIAVVVLIALAAARLVLPLPGGEHEPTAVAIVLDNSMSSGVIEGEERLLDDMKAIALETVDRATERDRIWVLRAAEPWGLSEPLTPAAARRRIADTEVSDAASALEETIRRAAELLRQVDDRDRELHVLSDFQRTALPQDMEPALPEGTALLALAPPEAPLENRYLSDLLVGDGLAPVAGQRTAITARVRSSGGADVSGITVRLVVEDDVRGAGESGSDGTVSLSAGPFAEGWLSGHLEMDPDLLADDDRIHFAFRVREPPSIETRGNGLFFVEEALGVLEASNRIRRDGGGAPELLLLGGADVTPGRDEGTPVVLLPPVDPTRIPAFNRLLVSLDIPWRLEVGEPGGGWSVARLDLPVDLEGVGVQARYELHGEGAESGPPLAELSDGSPWIVSGDTPQGPYLLLASPLVERASDLPVSPALIPFLEWVTGTWIGGGGAVTLHAGEPLRAPRSATHIRLPDGTERVLDGTLRFVETGRVGPHQVFGGDSLLQLVAVNPPASESVLEPLEPEEAAERLGRDVQLLDDARAWRRTAFRAGRAREPWRPLLVSALLLLLLEGRLAAGGSGDRGRVPRGNLNG